ncbi:hypothetical protein AKO1_013633 [Acrasis kona]|uniref:Uncharacterized protein n=1 Tax=Acrasis kona TaxID=1008807 RepID=A0AAW2YVY1_9EUKA
MYNAPHTHNRYKSIFKADNWSGVFGFSKVLDGDRFIAIGTKDYHSLMIVNYEKSNKSQIEPQFLLSEPQYHGDRIQCIEWADGHSILSCSRDHTVCKIDVKKQKQEKVWRTSQQYYSDPTSLCTTPNNKNLVYITIGSTCVAWDTRLRPTKNSLAEFNINIDDLSDCKIVDAGNMLVTSSLGGRLTFWDIRKSQVLQTITSPAPGNTITRLDVDHNFNRLSVNCSNDTAYLFDMCRIKPQDKNIENIDGVIALKSTINRYEWRAASFSTFSNYCITGGDDGIVHVWNSHSGKRLNTIESPPNKPRVLQSSFIPASHYLESSLVAVTYASPNCTYFYELEAQEDPHSCQEFFSDFNMDETQEEADAFQAFQEAESSWDMDVVDVDYAECTHSMDYIEQTVFICLTCSHSSHGVKAGMCRQCAHFCHSRQGHETVNIGIKKAFKCDCGLQDKFGSHGCELQDEKSATDENVYNHNFENLWCYCNRPEERPMFQCTSCQDWFHSTCIGADESVELEYRCDICLNDENKCKYLTKYPNISSTRAVRGMFLKDDWETELTPEDLQRDQPRPVDHVATIHHGLEQPLREGEEDIEDSDGEDDEEDEEDEEDEDGFFV